MWVLIEHFGGTFPLWMSPRQVRIIPVAETFNDYAKKVESEIKKEWIRVTADYSSDGLNKKVRNAEKMHNNYILVLGEQEQTEGTVSVRNYKTKEQTSEKTHEFIGSILNEIEKRDL
jgi:threonyl-tRNA synthetase